MNVQDHNSSELLLKYSEDQTSGLMKLVIALLTVLRVVGVLCSLGLVLERNAVRELPESSRLEFQEKISVNKCALLDAEDNTPGPLETNSRFIFVEKLFAVVRTLIWETPLCCFVLFYLPVFSLVLDIVEMLLI